MTKKPVAYEDNSVFFLFMFSAMLFVAILAAAYLGNVGTSQFESECKAHCATMGLNYTSSEYRTSSSNICICEVNTVIFAFSKSYDQTCIRKVGEWYQCGIQQMAVIG